MTLLSLLVDATHILLVFCAAAAHCSLSWCLLSTRIPQVLSNRAGPSQVYIPVTFLILDCVFSGERPDAYPCWASCYSTLPDLSKAECLEPIFQVTYQGIKPRCITLFLWSLNSHCINYVNIFPSLSSLRSKDQDTKRCEAQERENGEICQLDLVDQ